METDRTAAVASSRGGSLEEGDDETVEGEGEGEGAAAALPRVFTGDFRQHVQEATLESSSVRDCCFLCSSH